MGFRTLRGTRSDSWIHFLHFYAKIVEDCPLVMRATDKSSTIAGVTLKIDVAKASGQGGSDTWFQVRRIIEDKSGLSGEIYVVDSFSRSPLGRHAEIAPAHSE
jgi:hypothetical protein